MNFTKILKDVGVPVTENLRSGSPGTFNPVGVIWHHTAGVGDGVVSVVKNGRPGIPGPLCNALLRPDGEWMIITTGKANDSGMGSGKVLEEVRNNKPVREDAYKRGLSDTINGNPYFYDIEVEHVGTHGDYPRQQLRSLVLGTAAILKEQGWGVNRCIHHRQWSRRKVDMSYRGNLWKPVRRTLRTLKRPVLTKGSNRTTHIVELHKRLYRMGIDKSLTHNKLGLPRVRFTEKTVQAVTQFQTRKRLYVDGIVGSKTWLRLFNQHFAR